MANLYTDSKLGDVVKVSRSDGGYYEMMVVCKTEPNEIWLLDKAGREPDSWDNRQTKCNIFKNTLAKSVYDEITETRLLNRDECDGKGKIQHFVLSAIKDLIGKEPIKKYWWTNTEYNSVGAYAFNKYGTHNHTKTNAYGIHPLIILNGSEDIPGITLPPKTIPVPTLSQKSYEYDGNSYEPTIDYKGNEDNITTSKSYSGKQSAIGKYTITFTLKDTTKYNWSDNSKGAIAAAVLTWEIKAPSFTYIDIPTADGDSFEYNGSPQSPELSYDESNVTFILPNAYINAGSYTGYFRLKDKSKTKWADGSMADIPFTWSITRKKISTVPTQKGSLTYNGKSQSPKWNNYDSAQLSIGGTTSGIDAGTYMATFTPNSNHCWEDGSTSAINADWAVNRLKITPPKQVGELIYNKKRQSPTWSSDYDPSFVLDDEEVSGIDAGSYPVVFRCGKNYCFDPHDPESDMQFTGNWNIQRSPTAVPPVIVDKKFEYDGMEHRPTWEVEDIDTIYLKGDLSATNAGKYTIRAYPTSNYCWSDKTTTGKPYSWEITRKPIQKDPSIRDTALEYNGKEQSPELVNYPQDFVSGTGLSAVDAGEHTAVYTIDGNHSWTDGTYEPIRIKWKIGRKKIPKPYYNNKLVFNGSEQHPNWAGINFGALEEAEDDEGNKILCGEYFEVSGDLNGIHADEYTTVFTPTANYQWDTGDYAPYSVDWMIDKYHFKYPYQAENRVPEHPTMYYDSKSEYLVYNSTEQSPTLWFGNIYDKTITRLVLENAFAVRKTSSAVNVGDYVVELTPDSDHCWADGNSEPYDVPWKIIKCKLSSPLQNTKGLSIPTPRGEQYYTGETIYPEFDNYDPNVLEISGKTSGIDVGDYTAYFEIRDKDNYEWADGRTGKIPVTWRIINAPKLIHHPYQSNHPVYNGRYQSPEWNGYDTKAMFLVGGDPQKRDVGKYEAEFCLKHGYAWIDETTENAIVPWYIYKIPVPRPYIRGTDMEGLNGQFVEIDGKKYPVWENYNPDLMIMSGDTYTVDEYPKLTVFTLKHPDIYRWRGNYEWADASSEPLEVRWVVSMPYDPKNDGRLPGSDYSDDDYPDNDNPDDLPGDIDDTPRDNISDGGGGLSGDIAKVRPGDIATAIRGDIHDKIWHIGDKVPIKINGDVGGVRFKDAWFYAYIIGFNHNMEIEGGGRSIHFQFAKFSQNDKEIAFTDKFYGRIDAGNGFCMNTTDTAKGGWRDSYMRNTICRQFYEALPKEWQDVIISCPKYTDNVGDGNGAESSVTMTKDKIFLLSEYECLGRNVSSNHAEDNYQKQYDYYKENGYTGKGKYSALNEEAECWLRSPYYDTNDQFCVTSYSYYNPSGGVNGEYAADSYGFAPCFAVGELYSASAGGDFYDDDDPNKPTDNLKRVHIPQQIDPPYEDETVKSPQWDEYDDIAIINLGGEWNGISADTYKVILNLNPGYIWEDGTREIKTVPWRILPVGEPMPTKPAPIRVHIPEQIDPPHFDGTGKTPEWDEWNRFAINVIGGTLYGVIATEYTVKVELKADYVWEDGTTDEKYLPWVILPRVFVDELPDEDKPEIIEQDKSDPDKPYDPDDPNVDTGDNIPDDSECKHNTCCGCCDTGLFDKLNNCDCDDGAECDCTKDVEI